MKTSGGFTLIETIIYTGLFAMITGGAIVTSYQIIQAGERSSVKAVVQNEESFVLRKIDWALSSVKTINSPLSGSGSTLSVTRYDGTTVQFRLNGNTVEINEGSGYVPLTTSNVTVTALTFTFVQSGSGPSGIRATLTIKNNTDPQTFTESTTKYVRN